MAVVRFSLLKRAIFSPPFQLGLAAQSRCISNSRYVSEEPKDPDSGYSQDVGSAALDSASVEAQNLAHEGGKPSASTRPYLEELRESLTAKYLRNQPVAKPHSLHKRYSEKLTLSDVRVKYAKRVSNLRKKYAREVEKKKAAKATHDLKERQELLAAKEERLRLKKEKSAQRALEVEKERQIFQAQLASERAERASKRKDKDRKLEERRLKERDIIRQQSGTWIEEKDLEGKVSEAYANPIEL